MRRISSARPENSSALLKRRFFTPLGASGAIIIGTLLDELERSDKEVGLATLCVASGMGAATIIERV